MSRRIFSRYWYVRSDTHVYDYDSAAVEIAAARDTPEDSDQHVVSRWRGRLYSPSEVAIAKQYLCDGGYGDNVRAVKVTVYKKEIRT